MNEDVLSETLEAIARGDRYASSLLLYRLSGLSSGQMKSWSESWLSLDEERRVHTITRLVELAEDDFASDFSALFRQALTDPVPEVRSKAVDGLWEDENLDLIPVLLEMATNDAFPIVRARAASSLGSYVYLGEIEELDSQILAVIVDTLFSIIADKGEALEVRRRAVEAVAFSSDPRTRDVISRAYHDADEMMQASAVFAMGRNADPYWQGTVVLELENESEEIRFEAIRAAGELESPLAVQPLIRLLNDPDREIREMAVWSLGQIGGTDARKALERCHREGDEGLREVVEEALAELDLSSGEWPSLLLSFE
ncbi:MAG: hypothetical protein GXP41_06710 [Chloroflexi bacterium]|nr:hypothetical protein [Chloroflexota bacterium]